MPEVTYSFDEADFADHEVWKNFLKTLGIEEEDIEKIGEIDITIQSYKTPITGFMSFI